MSGRYLHTFIVTKRITVRSSVQAPDLDQKWLFQGAEFAVETEVINVDFERTEDTEAQFNKAREEKGKELDELFNMDNEDK